MSYLIFYLGIGIIYGLYLFNEVKNIILYLDKAINKTHIAVVLLMSVCWPLMLLFDIINFINYFRLKGKPK